MTLGNTRQLGVRLTASLWTVATFACCWCSGSLAMKQGAEGSGRWLVRRDHEHIEAVIDEN